MDARSSDGLGCASLAAHTRSRVPPPKREGPLFADIRRAGEMHAVVDAWHELAKRALEPSLFAEPGFLLPALQHIPEGRHVAVLCAWQGAPQTGALRGLFPVLAPRFSTTGRDLRVWQPPFFIRARRLAG